MPSSSKLTVTAFLDDRVTGPMREIGKEAQRMGQGFGKTAQVLRMFEGASTGVGGAVAEAGSKIGGLASVLATGGAFGIAVAAATLAAQGFSKALEVIADNAQEALENSDVWKRAAAIQKLDEIERERAKKLQDDLKASLAGVDADIAARKTMADALERFGNKREALEETARQRRKKAEEDAQRARGEAYDNDRDAAIARIDNKSSHRLATIDAEIEHELESARFLDASLTKSDEEREARAVAVAGAVEDLSRATTAILIADSEEARNAATKAAVSMALDKITAAAASGAASAAEGAIEQFPYPYNLIVAAVASAAVYAAITAFRAKVLHAASGGMVAGGTPGRDSVPAMLMPGELVMPVAVAKQFERMAREWQRPSSPSTTTHGAVNVNLNIQTLDPSAVNDSQLRRIARKLGNEIEVMRGRGMVRRGAA